MRPKAFFISLLTISTVVLSAAVPSPSAPSSAPADEFSELKRQIAESAQWNLARLQKEVSRPDSLILSTDRTPLDIVLRRATALLKHLQSQPNPPDVSKESAELESLRSKLATASPDESKQREFFAQVISVRRRIAFKNPLLDFNQIVFLKHNKQARGAVHMVDQYLGFNAEKAGGVYVLEKPFSAKPVVRSILEKARVENGPLKGQCIDNKGGFISLDLDFDGRSLLFGFTEAEWKTGTNVTHDPTYWTEVDRRGYKATHTPEHYVFRPEGCYHVFRANVDGSGLTQLTNGPWNDFDPCFLPNGRITFISSRCGGQCRCGARPLPTYTLHAMMPDGSDIIPLSWHDTNEWQPSVDNNGMIVYTRWDYVDRDSDVAHHIWRCYPDGRDPRSPHGNYPDVRESRPWMEMSIRAIPGSSKYVAVAAPHHGEDYGSLVMIDLEQHDDRSTSQLRRITPETRFPESEQMPGIWQEEKKPSKKLAKNEQLPKPPPVPSEVYGTPWPLSEDFFLCVYDAREHNYGIYLVDSFGNRELIYRDPAIACLDPIPLRPRARPPVVPVATLQAKADRGEKLTPATGTVAVMNVYESRQAWPKDVQIKELRVINVFAKDSAVANVPDVGAAAQSLCRGVLGTVPVESDGSVHFTIPAGAPVYFQLLDEKGLMVHTMRSATYVHPGEKLTCSGCHESQHNSPAPADKSLPIALRRAPSQLKPELSGSYPLTFPRLVQPVLDAKCVSCHDQNKKAPRLHGERFAKNDRSEAFESLRKFAWGMSGGNGVARRERQYSIPGQDGARVTKLYALLQNGHHNVTLTPEEMRRITLWLDCNSNFFGAYQNPDKQARGEVVRPIVGVPAWMDFTALVR